MGEQVGPDGFGLAGFAFRRFGSGATATVQSASASAANAWSLTRLAGLADLGTAELVRVKLRPAASVGIAFSVLVAHAANPIIRVLCSDAKMPRGGGLATPLTIGLMLCGLGDC